MKNSTCPPHYYTPTHSTTTNTNASSKFASTSSRYTKAYYYNQQQQAGQNLYQGLDSGNVDNYHQEKRRGIEQGPPHERGRSRDRSNYAIGNENDRRSNYGGGVNHEFISPYPTANAVSPASSMERNSRRRNSYGGGNNNSRYSTSSISHTHTHTMNMNITPNPSIPATNATTLITNTSTTQNTPSQTSYFSNTNNNTLHHLSPPSDNNYYNGGNNRRRRSFSRGTSASPNRMINRGRSTSITHHHHQFSQRQQQQQQRRIRPKNLWLYSLAELKDMNIQKQKRYMARRTHSSTTSSSSRNARTLTFEEEMMKRAKAAQFIKSACFKLELGHHVLATATIFMHRYCVRQSLLEEHYQDICSACIFLATKLFESKDMRRMSAIIEACAKVSMKDSEYVVTPRVYGTWERNIVHYEMEVLEVLCYDLDLEANGNRLPHTYVKDYLSHIKCKNETSRHHLMKYTYCIINDCLSTVLCLRFKWDVITAACIYVASKILDDPIITYGHSNWWDSFNLNEIDLKNIIREILMLYTAEVESTLPINRSSPLPTAVTPSATGITSGSTPNAIISSNSHLNSPPLSNPHPSQVATTNLSNNDTSITATAAQMGLTALTPNANGTAVIGDAAAVVVASKVGKNGSLAIPNEEQLKLRNKLEKQWIQLAKTNYNLVPSSKRTTINNESSTTPTTVLQKNGKTIIPQNNISSSVVSGNPPSPSLSESGLGESVKEEEEEVDMENSRKRSYQDILKGSSNTTSNTGIKYVKRGVKLEQYLKNNGRFLSSSSTINTTTTSKSTPAVTVSTSDK